VTGGTAEPAALVAVEGPPLAGGSCPWCGTALQGGQPAAVCRRCGSAYHVRCWNGHGGCRVGSCPNTPLPRIVPRVQRRPCVHCGGRLAPKAVACPVCRRAQTPDGRWPRRRPFAPHARPAFVLGLCAWIPLLGVAASLLAFFQARRALGALDQDPGRRGRALAVAGLVLAIPPLLVHLLGVVALFLAP